MHITEYLASVKVLLARLYLKVKVCVTVTKSVYNKKSYALHGITLLGFSYFGWFLWPWKLAYNEQWMNFFLVFLSLMTYLNFYIFKDSSDLENLSSVNIKRTFSLTLNPWGLATCLVKLHVFTGSFYFHHNLWQKGEEKKVLQVFLKDFS